MKPYPITLNLGGLPCLVVGGGGVAFRKASRLVEAGASLTVVSPTVIPDFEDLKSVTVLRQNFNASDINGMFLVIAATDDAEVNKLVAEGCRIHATFCNVVDTPELCSAVLPAVLERGNLQIAVSTGMTAPAFAAALVRWLEETLPAHIEDYLGFLGEARRLARERIDDPEHRKRLAKYLASPEGQSRFVDATPGERSERLDGLLADPAKVPDGGDG